MSTALPIATLIIYLILIQPITYCVWKHGRHGLLGWLTIQIFCAVRVVGAIIQIHQEDTHSTNTTTVLLLNNIGLSPLLLAVLGILHEARTARNPALKSKFEWFKVLNFHGFVIAAMALVIVGVVEIMGDKTYTPNTLMKVGVVMLLLAWSILSAWVLISMRTPPRNHSSIPLMTPNTMELAYGRVPAFAEATLLLYGTALVLPFVGVRDVYAALSIFISSAAFKNSLAAKVVMSVVPEMIVTIILAVVGIRTRHISALRKVEKA
ncbi:uncharacterized protein PAC_14513 [Phialocephala subalpina]|uniref:DUF7702 domain-containing protein n=1 Tax=Phialocephala subalpina TaxID=576137 RepID=A0A1L7XHU4_9HELO|nr:uncharacterized protein PAC_14513 [Phialocephala subalpina]